MESELEIEDAQLLARRSTTQAQHNMRMGQPKVGFLVGLL